MIGMDELEQICREMFGEKCQGKIQDRDVLLVSRENMPIYVALWSESGGDGDVAWLSVQAHLVEIDATIDLFTELLSRNRGPNLWAFSIEPVEDGGRVCVYMGGTQILTPDPSLEMIQSYIAGISAEGLEMRQWLASDMGGDELVLEIDSEGTSEMS